MFFTLLKFLNKRLEINITQTKKQQRNAGSVISHLPIGILLNKRFIRG